MENSVPWHSKKVNAEEYTIAMEELKLQDKITKFDKTLMELYNCITIEWS